MLAFSRLQKLTSLPQSLSLELHPRAGDLPVNEHCYFLQMEPDSKVTIKSIGVDLTETAFRLGVITVNEFRQCVGFDPVAGGDVVFDMTSFQEYWARKNVS